MARRPWNSPQDFKTGFKTVPKVFFIEISSLLHERIGTGWPCSAGSTLTMVSALTEERNISQRPFTDCVRCGAYCGPGGEIHPFCNPCLSDQRRRAIGVYWN